MKGELKKKNTINTKGAYVRKNIWLVTFKMSL